MQEKPTGEAVETGSTPEGMNIKPTAGAIIEKPAEAAMMDAPGWFSIPLTNVSTGQAFTIGDYKGKVVLLENMAIWCTTCLRQQNQVLELHRQMGETPDLISIGLDIDPNEDADMLKQYTESKGFDWTYAVAPVDMSREIGQLYGAQFLNPPSAPMLIIDRKGNVHPLPFGVKNAEDLSQAIQPFLDEGG
jgi:thiol-disulfide isomerase/thioredoxin